MEKAFLQFSQNLQEKPCIGVSVLNKVTEAQVFEIFKNTFFTERFWATASCS